MLTGLTPDTEYFYRLQGVGPDGRLYQSELLTFTTLSAPESTAPGKNVALGAQVIEVSSEFSAAFGAANAVDGDLATEWSSAGDGDSSFITIDLGSVQDLIGVEFLTRTMGDGSATTETFYVVVDDGERRSPGLTQLRLRVRPSGLRSSHRRVGIRGRSRYVSSPKMIDRGQAAPISRYA